MINPKIQGDLRVTNNEEQLQKDLLRMQERIAWLEQNQEETAQLVYSLAERLDKAERLIKFLASMQEAPAAVRPLSEETPPPHY